MSKYFRKVKLIRDGLKSPKWCADNNLTYTDISDMEDKANSQVYAFATRLCRAMGAEKHTEVGISDITQAGLAITAQLVPLFMYPEKLPENQDKPEVFGTVRVFPNVWVSIKDIEKLKLASVYHYQDMLEDFWNKYQTELQDPHKGKRWKQPTGRIWTMLKKSVVMNNGRFIREYLNEKISDKELASVCTKWEQFRKPMELIWCKTPEDFKIMYATGPASCMTGDTRVFAWMAKQGTHPGAFWLHHPWANGVFIMHKGAVAARAIVYDPPGKGKYLGRIYASDPELNRKFVEQLNKLGYKKSLRDGDKSNPVPYHAEFDVPGIQKEGHTGPKALWYMPFPYLDNHYAVQLTFNTDTHMFHVKSVEGAEANEKGIYRHLQSGFVQHDHLSTTPCNHCGNMIPPKNQKYTTLDGTRVYCSARCYTYAGYVQALDNDGNQKLIPREVAVMDAFQPSVGFTTEMAAGRNGAILVREEVFIDEEDARYTRHASMSLPVKGSKYALANNAYNNEVYGNMTGSERRDAASDIPFTIVERPAVVMPANHIPVQEALDNFQDIFQGAEDYARAQKADAEAEVKESFDKATVNPIVYDRKDVKAVDSEVSWISFNTTE